jgi:hypothetical protein
MFAYFKYLLGKITLLLYLSRVAEEQTIGEKESEGYVQLLNNY